MPSIYSIKDSTILDCHHATWTSQPTKFENGRKCVCVLHNSKSNKKRTCELNPLVANFWFQYSRFDFELTLQEARFHILWQKDFNLFQSPSKENVRMDSYIYTHSFQESIVRTCFSARSFMCHSKSLPKKKRLWISRTPTIRFHKFRQHQTETITVTVIP